MSWWEPMRTGEPCRRRIGFVGTKAQALTQKMKAKVAAATAEPAAAVVLASSVPTLYEFARDRLQDPLAPRVQLTTDRYETAYRLRIHEHLGAYQLDELTPPMVRDWCDALARREGTRRSAEYAFRALHWLLNEAVDDGMIATNPAAGIRYAKRARAAVVREGAPSAEDHARKKPALTRAQYEQLKSRTATRRLHDQVFIRLAVEGTLRRAELAALRWGGYDPEARTFEVTGGVTHTKTTGTVVGDPKNTNSVRTIVLSGDLCQLLDEYREECLGGGEPEHFLFAGRAPRSRRFDPLRPLNPRSVTDLACRLVQLAGLVDDAGKHLTDLQGLRATGSSIADAAGVPRSIVEAQLGHRQQRVRAALPGREQGSGAVPVR